MKREIETAERLMKEKNGLILHEAPTDADDYIDEAGKLYDQIGNDLEIARRWLRGVREKFLKEIIEHMSTDFVVIDLTGFPEAIIREVIEFIKNLPKAQQDKIIPIGFKL
jgi:hypothetical protein